MNGQLIKGHLVRCGHEVASFAKNNKKTLIALGVGAALGQGPLAWVVAGCIFNLLPNYMERGVRQRLLGMFCFLSSTVLAASMTMAAVFDVMGEGGLSAANRRAFRAAASEVLQTGRDANATDSYNTLPFFGYGCPSHNATTQVKVVQLPSLNDCRIWADVQVEDSNGRRTMRVFRDPRGLDYAGAPMVP